MDNVVKVEVCGAGTDYYFERRMLTPYKFNRRIFGLPNYQLSIAQLSIIMGMVIAYTLFFKKQNFS